MDMFLAFGMIQEGGEPGSGSIFSLLIPMILSFSICMFIIFLLRKKFSIGSKAYDFREFNQPPEKVRAALKHALNQLNWTYVVNQAEQLEYRVKVPFSIWSYGERVEVKIGREGKVELTSTCSVPFQIFDWGKNRRNIEEILEYMNRVL